MNISVLIPVYNGATTLAGAIESILAQDVDDFELLVIDDASSDGSAAIARRYAAEDARLQVYSHEHNVGLAVTLNEGLERAANDLVARMDQDDEALPARLRVQQRFMEENPNVVVAGSFVLHMGASARYDRLVELPSGPGEIARVLPRENCLYHPSVVLRRPAVLDAGGYRAEFKNAEDYDLWLRLARFHDLANVPEPLLRYRFSTRGMTLSRKWEQLFYVHLAQEVNRHEGTSLELATTRAEEAVAEVDRRWFMQQVATGTVVELGSLHLWSDALRLIQTFARDIGAVAAATLVASLVARRFHG